MNRQARVTAFYQWLAKQSAEEGFENPVSIDFHHPSNSNPERLDGMLWHLDDMVEKTIMTTFTVDDAGNVSTICNI